MYACQLVDEVFKGRVNLWFNLRNSQLLLPKQILINEWPANEKNRTSIYVSFVKNLLTIPLKGLRFKHRIKNCVVQILQCNREYKCKDEANE